MNRRFTEQEIDDLILRAAREEGDTNDPKYFVTYAVKYDMAEDARSGWGAPVRCKQQFTLLQARLLVRELRKRSCHAWIEVE